MNNCNPKSGEHPFSDEEGKRNLVGFFRLLHEVDMRNKGKGSHSPVPMPEKKVNLPNRVPGQTKVEEELRISRVQNLADHTHGSQPLHVPSGKNLSESITIRLDPETLQSLRSLAHERGVGPTTLIRMWVMERLKVMRS